MPVQHLREWASTKSCFPDATVSALITWDRIDAVEPGDCTMATLPARCDRILPTSHTARSTGEASGRLLALIRDNLDWSSGGPVRNVVNGTDAILRRRTG